MESKTISVSWIALVMAACSLFSMGGTLEIDGIINRDLYQYGLQFNYAWATPYWTTAAFVFAMGWLNIIIALGVHVHALVVRRGAIEEVAGEAEEEMTPVKVIEESKEEKTKTIEADAKPKDLQAVVIDTNMQKEKEKPIEVKEAPAHVKSEAERAEEQESQ